MKATCELCETGEPSMAGATSRSIAIGERCYGKLVDKNISWAENTPLRDLIEGVRVRIPRPVSRVLEGPDEPEGVLA